ncbi:hypothetical protein PtA15_7A537 [Puccinia triticina]|uniref:Uncharacterized protein n=1 Tax=Puccinia triticina TaxID=208348 RepID=A0ABY7CPF5_9BASI|nr:uncharacterized protein PtA15_7A537 [Puccinia triticina]WAQ86808.1 hypothetical protein PtA15_7A537 [Puccinia triticina]WAR56673.1 hypothetical protein PtB15_7B523 [Puccinia triticina]
MNYISVEVDSVPIDAIACPTNSCQQIRLYLLPAQGPVPSAEEVHPEKVETTRRASPALYHPQPRFPISAAGATVAGHHRHRSGGARLGTEDLGAAPDAL